MAYEAADYPPFAVTADLVVLTLRSGRLHVLLVRRGGRPYAGKLALPGGFTQVDEDIEEAAYRELAEECGVGRGAITLEQLRTYGTPGRDPRMRVVSVAWLAIGPDLPEPRAGSDAAEAGWFDVEAALADDLAFDHPSILRDGVERARAKLEYTALAAALLPEEFTVGELREVYEAVWGRQIDPRNFHRKVTGAEGFLHDTGRRTTRGGGRPARLFRADAATPLHPPILRRD
jgi:8-oxo-dGTP diphosphatase